MIRQYHKCLFFIAANQRVALTVIQAPSSSSSSSAASRPVSMEGGGRDSPVSPSSSMLLPPRSQRITAPKPPNVRIIRKGGRRLIATSGGERVLKTQNRDFGCVLA